MAEHYDVLVVGAGPAGLAAARAAAGAGARVGLLDAQARAGGQVWRHDVDHRATALARRRLAFVHAHPGIEWLASNTVVAATDGKLLVEDPHAARWLDYGALVLATGAHELLLPFPGWTLQGVTGAGGLQALAKQGWPLAGRRVVVAGSGPLLLAAAASIRRHGGHVVGIHEQAGYDDLRDFVRGLWRWPGKVLQAAALRARLAGVPYHGSSVVVAAHGDDRLREIEVEGPRGRRRLFCDQLAVGYGLVPEVRLASLLGCRLDAAGAHHQVWVDDAQRTSLANVYAAGETCGIGGRDCAVAEGAIAGHAAAGRPPSAALRRRRHHTRAFAAHLARHFALDERVRRLPQPDTLVCRCEDVSMKALDGHSDARAAKLATRSGMGSCQGRICGSALAALGRFPSGGHRPPLFPARLDTLGDTDFT